MVLIVVFEWNDSFIPLSSGMENELILSTPQEMIQVGNCLTMLNNCQRGARECAIKISEETQTKE